MLTARNANQYVSWWWFLWWCTNVFTVGAAFQFYFKTNTWATMISPEILPTSNYLGIVLMAMILRDMVGRLIYWWIPHNTTDASCSFTAASFRRQHATSDHTTLLQPHSFASPLYCRQYQSVFPHSLHISGEKATSEFNNTRCFMLLAILPVVSTSSLVVEKSLTSNPSWTT